MDRSPVRLEVEAAHRDRHIRLHKLMHLENDKLDWSFVEKVILSREEVLSLVHCLMPHPAPSSPTRLDPHVLEGCELYTIGFYGNKKLMQAVLQGLHIQIDESEKARMEEEPGIYACRQGDFLYVFYWHDQEILAEASLKSICCNFIRYLVELCNVVYVCVTGNDVRDYLAATSPRPKPPRPPVSLHVGSPVDNEVIVNSGFQESIGNQQSHSYILGAGLHSTVLLSGQLNPFTVLSMCQEKKENLSPAHVLKFAKEWSMRYRFNFLDLDDDEFGLLLSCISEASSEWKIGWKELETLRRAHEAERQKRCHLVDPEQELIKAQKGLVQVFTRYLEDYLLLVCPWEEQSHRNALHGPRDGSLMDVSAEQSHRNALHGPPDGSLMDVSAVEDELSNLFTNLESEVCQYFDVGDSKGPKKLLFFGSKISLVCEKKQVMLCINRERLDVRQTSFFNHSAKDESILFLIKSAKQRLGPVQYNEKIYLCPFDTPTSVQASLVTLSPADNHRWGGLLRVGDSVCLPQFPNYIFTIHEDEASSSGHMKRWIESFVDLKALRLKEKARSLSYEVGSQEGKGFRIQNLPLFIDYIWDRCLSIPPDDDIQIETEVVVCLLKKYSNSRKDLLGRVGYMIEKEIGSWLRGTFELKRKQDSKQFELTCKQEEVALLSELKAMCSNQGSGEVQLQMQRCYLEGNHRQMNTVGTSNSLRDSQQRISIKFQYPVNRDKICWSAVEMRLMKNDLDELARNPWHVVVPQLYAHPQPFLELDKELESLQMVALLENQQVLAFVTCMDGDKKCLQVRMYNLISSLASPKYVMAPRKGCDLMCFSETKRFVAFYDREEAFISLAVFDGAFRRLQQTSIDIDLARSMGKKFRSAPPDLVYMDFAYGNADLDAIVAADGDSNLWVFELSLDGRNQESKYKKLRCPIYPDATCVTPDGSLLLVLEKVEMASCDDDRKFEDTVGKTSAQDKSSVSGNLLLHVVELQDKNLKIKRVVLIDIEVEDLAKIQTQLVMFGSQMQLILHDSNIPRIIRSQVIRIPDLSGLRRRNIRDHEKARSCPALAYVPLIFEKFAVSHHLVTPTKTLEFRFLHSTGGISEEDMKKTVIQVEKQVRILDKSRGKDFSKWDISFSSKSIDQLLMAGIETSGFHAEHMRKWIHCLVCLVPIQIARAEQNGLTPCVDGLLTIRDHVNATELVEGIKFGFYDDLIINWKGDVKVVSSMGKQSSGKSYLLNHLFGSLFDVAAVRCTDGIWLTLRQEEDCLYVLLDFEGFDSPERTVQEDTLLALVSAAISNMTIYNKKDSNFDKEVERIFLRLQNAVALIQANQQLFRGLLCFALKDVAENEVEDIEDAFFRSLKTCCEKNGNAFLTKMYDSTQLQIMAMEPFLTPQFFQSIGGIANILRDVRPTYKDGTSFLDYSKLFISQVVIRDWGPIDCRRKALRLAILRQQLKEAVNSGCTNKSALINLDTREPIEDASIVLKDTVFSLVDTKLELALSLDDVLFPSILPPLRDVFTIQVEHDDRNEEDWFSLFESFLMAVVNRRCTRVHKWLKVNTEEFDGDDDTQKLGMEADAMLVSIKQGLTLCGAKCEICFLKCILPKSHSARHSCQGNHKCSKKCTVCLESNPSSSEVPGCRDVAGHSGSHDCDTKHHECKKTCIFYESSSGCNQNCAKRPGHPGEHLCNSARHLCQEPCALGSCSKSCSVAVELGEHNHVCDLRRCPERCAMLGCNDKCSSDDHFHVMQPNAEHLCGNRHLCPEDCEIPGICEVVTKPVIVKGKLISEQTGSRKKCSIMIPANRTQHEGPHCHSSNQPAVHQCEVKCGSCGYFCTMEMGHEGLHDTNHGNMRGMTFVAEEEGINVSGRPYAWGDTGHAELCSIFCQKKGRGHIHYVPCELSNGGTCAETRTSGAKHVDQQVGPSFDVRKDKLTHAAYWLFMGFKDPYSDKDQEDFAGCDHYCRADEHRTPLLGTSGEKSFCQLKLWHKPIATTYPESGYVSSDGHHFPCEHENETSNHLIFVIDRSRSMALRDSRPAYFPFNKNHYNRLGCVYEALLGFLTDRGKDPNRFSYIISVVLFSVNIKVLFKREPLSKQKFDSLQKNLMREHPEPGTNFEKALGTVQELVDNPRVRTKAENTSVIFLSDGKSDEGGDPVEAVKRLRKKIPELTLYTVKFGTGDDQVLRQMAAAGGGEYKPHLAHVQLEDHFQDILRSAQDKSFDLMPSTSLGSRSHTRS